MNLEISRKSRHPVWLEQNALKSKWHGVTLRARQGQDQTGFIGCDQGLGSCNKYNEKPMEGFKQVSYRIKFKLPSDYSHNLVESTIKG